VKVFKIIRTSIWGYAISILVGAGGWVYLAASTTGREGWDNPFYFTVFFPILALLSGVLGFFFQSRPWRWGLVMFWTQALMAFIEKPMAPLLPIGLILFGILSLPCVVTAYCGAFLRSITKKLHSAGSDD
jgi:hypothetical protein